MATRPNDQQIAAEIAELKRIQPLVPPRTRFGDSNTDAIDAQIEVLEQRLDEQAVDDRRNFEDEDEADDAKWSIYAGESAMDAARWLNGNRLDAPHTDWLILLK